MHMASPCAAYRLIRNMQIAKFKKKIIAPPLPNPGDAPVCDRDAPVCDDKVVSEYEED